MAQGNVLLEVEQVVVGYHEADILKGVNLEVREGQIVSIVGPNGAGKSTLAKTIFGLLVPRDGDIRFCGESLVGMKPSNIVKKGLCYVPQEKNVFPNLTVAENLQMGGFLLKEETNQMENNVYELFPVLNDKKHHRAGTLSGGQRQMLAMGRALMLKPSLLVLDEPSAGLAPQMVDTVFERITEINARGCSILMVEQNARRALAMSSKGYVLDMGRNAIEDTGPALLDDPKVIELYLGEMQKGREAAQQ